MLISISQFSLFSGISNFRDNKFNNFTAYYFFGAVFLIIAVLMMMNTVYSYIKLYNKFGHNGFGVENVFKEVRGNFLKSFFTIFLLCILYALIGVVSIILAGIPFIYFYISTTFVLPIRIFENKNLSEAFSKSFKLIKNNWWSTFGLVILSSITINILSIGLTLPLTTIAGAVTYAVGVADNNKLYSIIMLVYYSFAIISYYILMSVVFIIIAFQYFNLIEEKEHPTLFERIKEINMDNNIKL